VSLVAFTSVMWGVLLILPERRGEKFAWRLSRIPKLGGAASEFWRAVWMYRGRQKCIVIAMLLALVGHVGWVLMFYYAAQTFVAPTDLAQLPSLTEHFLIVPIGMTIQALFPTPGGIGGGEFGYGALYALVGKPRENGIVGSLVLRLINAGIGLIGYLVYLRMPRAERVEGSWSSDPASKLGRVEEVEAETSAV
jgi:hypothetical protein